MVSILLPGQENPNQSDEYPVYTRKGWRIPQEKPDTLHPRLMQIHAQELEEWRRGLTVRSESTHPYNCVGMIFASRRAWIEIDYINRILREDDFRQITLGQVMEGDIVLYKRYGIPSHVGLIITIDRALTTPPNIKVISKWGKDPEFIHFIEQVPEFLGSPAEYFTDRV